MPLSIHVGRLIGVMLLLLAAMASPAHAEPWLKDWQYVSITPAEARQVQSMREAVARQTSKIQAQRLAGRAVGLYANRRIYLRGDGVAQIVVDALPFMAQGDAHSLAITLHDDQQRSLDQLIVPLPGQDASHKIALLLPIETLPAGVYQLRAQARALDGSPLGQAGVTQFEQSADQAFHGAIPSQGVELVVLPTIGRGDTAWPISTGIPLPPGACSDVSRLVLLEEGRPVPAQWTVRSRWSPQGDASIRWVGLDFIARYHDGKPRAYRFALADAMPAVGSPGLQVTQDSQWIHVNTGPLRYTVSRQRFNGIDQAWLGDRQVIATPARGKDDATAPGAFIVDEHGKLHRASADDGVQVTVEEAGPVRVVIAARGWYMPESKDDPRLCRFITYLTSYAGVPAVFVSHHTIIAYDTRQRKLANVGFHLPMAQVRQWAAGVDGGLREGDVPGNGGSTWLHQHRDDAVRLNEAAAGRRADGWMAARTGQATVLCTLRDMWQKFPKEMEVSRDGLTLHSWPRHGLETFSREEETDLRHIFKARFAHQGKLLDLQMPQAYFDVLQEHQAAVRWDPENTAPIGFASTGEGASIGNDFAWWFEDGASADPTRWADLARRFQSPPHAMAELHWNVSAGVESPMAARDDQRWPLAERMMNHDFPTAMFNAMEHVGAYGMWIYANTFNTWREDWPGLHRIWQNSHYGHVGESWKLYFRGASPEVLCWARAQTDLFMNIATVHHAIPDVSPPGRQVGAMYHAKGFLPWGARQRGQFPTDSDVRCWGHFIDPDAYLWKYLLEGDLFARDLYHQWIQATRTGNYPTHGPGREAIQDVAMLLNAYAMTWDPQMILQLRRRGVDVTLDTQLEKASNAAGFPVWHKRWADRYHRLARDKRAVDVMESYVRAGYAHWAPVAFVHRHHPDDQLLKSLMPQVYEEIREVYRHPGERFDGFSHYISARRQERFLQLPELIDALDSAGVSEQDLAADGDYYPPTKLVAWNPQGRDFTLKIQMPMLSDKFDHSIVVAAPSGKIIRRILIGRHSPQQVDQDTVTLERRRFMGANIERVDIPSLGEKGLFTIELRGGFCQLAAPATDLPAEAALLVKDRPMRPSTGFSGVLAAPPEGAVELTIRGLGQGIKPPLMPAVTWVRLDDTAGRPPLLETTLMHFADKSAAVTLPAADGPRIHAFTAIGEPAIHWTGQARYLLLAPRAEDARIILPLLNP